jgi:hypothetical protein
MATSSSPVRIEAEIFEAAKLIGETMSRSAAQQLAHWARIGREVESSGTISQRDLGLVLAGRRSYDTLSPDEQAIVRAEWAERIAQRRAALDLAATFTAEGRSWVELDDDGNVAERNPPHS